MLDNIMRNFATTLRFVRWQDYLDVAIVSFVVYQGIKLIKNTRAAQLVKGIAFIIALLFISDWLNLIMVGYLLANAFQVGLIAVIVLFQPEFRRALEQVGRSKIGHIVKFSEAKHTEDVIASYCRIIVDAMAEFSKTRTGAIIVMERQTKLDEIIETGIMVNADISKELLSNIFITNTPLHDGAVVIRNFRIMAAACFLPLTQNTHISSELGSRHRAALGMSENSDSIVVICSEETGKLSIALDGELTRNFNSDSLYTVLYEMLKPQDNGKGGWLKLPWAVKHK